MTHDEFIERGTIPRERWKDIAVRVVGQIKKDHLTLLSGGIAFYAFLALFPALAAALLVFGLVADPSEVRDTVAQYASALPGSPDEPNSAQGLVSTGLERAAEQAGGALGFGLVATIAGALWTASSGVAGLIEGINAAYDLVDERPFPKKRGLAILLTFGAIVFVAVAVGLIAVTPVVLGVIGLGSVAELLVGLARWPLLAVAIAVALAVLYRVGPDREPTTRWRSPGALIATVLFLLGSAGFSFYASTAGSYGASYGALAGVIVLMFWFFLSAFSILMGAEVNSEIEKERRSMRTTTTGSRVIGQADPYLSGA